MDDTFGFAHRERFCIFIQNYKKLAVVREDKKEEEAKKDGRGNEEWMVVRGAGREVREWKGRGGGRNRVVRMGQ